MKCPYAFYIERQGGEHVFSRDEYAVLPTRGRLVPCGKCYACRKARASEWSVRLEHEAAYHEHSCFLTLTYDNASLPRGDDGRYVLSKRDVQLFLKRLRKKLQLPVRYFCCGEYGERTLRPHYHMILFGWSPKPADCIPVSGGSLSPVLMSLWQKGGVVVGSVSQASIRYTTGYMLKMYNLPKDQREMYRPWILCSRGLGLDYVKSHSEQILAGVVHAHGQQVGIPRYYAKKVEVPEIVKRERARLFEKAVCRRRDYTWERRLRDHRSILNEVNLSRRQRILEEEAKENIRIRSKPSMV